jgi:hypothetical protein
MEDMRIAKVSYYALLPFPPAEPQTSLRAANYPINDHTQELGAKKAILCQIDSYKRYLTENSDFQVSFAPSIDMDANRHAEVALSTWHRLNKLNVGGGGSVFIDGNSLSIADVVASAR